MDTQKIQQLQAMIQAADFLNEATKQVFLSKIPYLPENKFEDLFEIFAEDEEKRKKLKEKRVAIFEKYKVTVTGIYQKAKRVIISFKEKAVAKIDENELKNLDQELDQL